MPANGKTIRLNHETYLRSTLEDRRELKRIQSDPDLTAAGRRNKAAPIVERLRRRHAESVDVNRRHVDQARQEYMDVVPAIAQEDAAFRDPARSNGMRALAESASIAELRRAAARAVAHDDLAAAHGLRRAIISRSDIDERDRAQVIHELDSIGAEAAQSRLANLVAAQHAFAQLEFARPDADVPDPARILSAARAAATIPVDADGTMQQIPDADVSRLLELARVPRGGPADPLDAEPRDTGVPSLLEAYGDQ